jgi:hypothetical protein
MKRSSCLSALFVGLSVMATSVAFAAPDAQPKTKLVAQANPGGAVSQTADPADGTGTSAAPGAGPATGQGVQPAVTLGNAPATEPAADTPAEAEEEPAAPPKPRPWAGTQVYTTTSMSTQTLFRGQQQDWNPTVEQMLWLLPRYRLNKDFQIRARQIINYEYTNSDSTVRRNEPMLADTGLQLWYNGIPALAGIKPMVAATVNLPTSKASQSRTMLAAPGLITQFSKGVEHVLGGELFFLANLIYSHPIYRSNTQEISDPLPYSVACAGSNCDNMLSGSMNPSDTFSYMFLVAGEWGDWSPVLLYFGGSQWAYQPKETRNPVDGTMIGSPEGFNPTTVRQTSYFSAFLDYHANTWFTPEVGYWMSRSILDNDGTYGNVFFSRYNDMRVYFGFNVNIDNLMKQLEGGDADAGIVRAKNSRTPIMTF